MNLDKSINNLSRRINKIYPDTSSSNYNDGVNYWKGKRIISLDQWLKIEQDYTLGTALQYFPDDFLSIVFSFNMDSIGDPKLREDANKWYSDFKDLMEYKRNPIYGNTKCFSCLLSPDREEAAIFLGINKVIARALEREHNNNNISSPTTTTYPCSVLNVFECPYKRKANKETNRENNETSNFDVDYLFELSEIAFQLELALGKAQTMTESNDTIYEANFETGRVKEIRINYYPSSIDYPLEEKLAEVKRLSIVPIRNAQDIHHALTDRETLDKILEQGLDEENLKYKDHFLNFFMSIKDKVRIEDLFIAQNYHMSDNSIIQRQYANKCSLCQGFANIYCVNCNNIWLCSDHWKQYKTAVHDLC